MVKKSANSNSSGTTSTTYVVPSTSHEYAALSWYVAHVTSAPTLAAVDEESDHRIVWGLASGSEVHGKGFSASCVQVDAVVGAGGEPDKYDQLSIVLPRDRFDAFQAEAREAYARHFYPSMPITRVFYTRKYGENAYWTSFGSRPQRPLASVYMDGDMQNELLQDCKHFLTDRAIYTKLGRPYKRVVCLHGPPGTGKTSLVTAIASELDKDLAICNVDSLRDDTFIELMSRLPNNAILLFEDVDAMFKKRESNERTGMTFSTLLNSLDGVLHPDGALIFMTTNHLDKLDAALHRPGRVDRLVEVPYSTPGQRAKMWKALFGRAPPPDALLRDVPGISSAWLSEQLFALRDADAKTAAERLAAALAALHKSSAKKKASPVEK